MGGVDRWDQRRGYYFYKMKSRKYIFNFLIGVALTNSFKHPSSRLNKKKFQELVGMHLTANYCTRHRAGRVSTPIRPLPLQHFPTKVKSGSSDRKRGRCSLCSKKKVRNDTQWFCHECCVWLCHPGTAEDCFLLWHKKVLLIAKLLLNIYYFMQFFSSFL